MKYTTVLAALAASALAAPDLLHFTPGPQVRLRGLLGAEYAGLTAVRCYVGAGDAPAWSCDADLAPGYSLANVTVVRDGAYVEATLVPDAPTFADAKHALRVLRGVTHGTEPKEPERLVRLMAIDPRAAYHSLEVMLQKYDRMVEADPEKAFNDEFRALVDKHGADLPPAFLEALKAHPISTYRAMAEVNLLAKWLAGAERARPSYTDLLVYVLTMCFIASSVLCFILAPYIRIGGTGRRWYTRRWYDNPLRIAGLIFLACQLALGAIVYREALAGLDVGYALGYVVAAPISLCIRAALACMVAVDTALDRVFVGAGAGFQAFLAGAR